MENKHVMKEKFEKNKSELNKSELNKSELNKSELSKSVVNSSVLNKSVLKEQPKERMVSSLFTPDGMPIRVLSTSLGLMLLASAVMNTSAEANASTEFANNEPTLVEWSNEEVKAYYNSNIDWSIPNVELKVTMKPGTDGQSNESGGTTVVHHSGFGWESMLLYGLLMSRGSAYSSQAW